MTYYALTVVKYYVYQLLGSVFGLSTVNKVSFGLLFDQLMAPVRCRASFKGGSNSFLAAAVAFPPVSI